MQSLVLEAARNNNISQSVSGIFVFRSGQFKLLLLAYPLRPSMAYREPFFWHKGGFPYQKRKNMT